MFSLEELLVPPFTSAKPLSQCGKHQLPDPGIAAASRTAALFELK